MSRPAKLFISSIFFLLFVGLLGAGTLFYFAYQGGGNAETIDVVVNRGAPLSQVSEELHRQGVIRYPILFKWLLRVSAGNSKVRAGEFRFQKDMKLTDALRVLYHSEPIVHQVTIPEGWTIRQIAKVLAAQNLIREERFLELALDSRSAARFKLNTPTLEGFLFPDTYHFSRIDGEDRILERMVGRFFEKFTAEYLEEMKLKGWTLEKLVTLASIIEKETGTSEERTLVSSVFHNRLKKRMRLQSDPTTIYGIPNFNGNLTKADLLAYSPYNTYVIPGLPPGPIASPGLASLVAALRPAQSNYLFFVSNNQGSHIFSETYGQHAGKVEQYQKRGLTRTQGKRKRR